MFKEEHPSSVLLVTVLYNSEGHLKTFLECLISQSMPNWRLIVVDNASPDGSFEIVARCVDSRIRILRNSKNLGFGRAANQGLLAAAEEAGDLFVIINSDIRFGPTFLAELVAARGIHHARVIAPRIMLLSRPTQAWYAGGHFDKGWLFTNVHDIFDPEDNRSHRLVEFATGCCLGIDRSVLETVGLFDESFFVYWEDSDLSVRLNAADVPIHYVRDPYLLHEGGASSGGECSPAHDRLYFRSYAIMLRRHFGPVRALVTLARCARQEVERFRRPARAARIVRAMLGGMLAPLRPIPRLPSRPDQPARGGPGRMLAEHGGNRG